ncbi:hypothetical protein Tco_0449830 [Tanacetum coccineum]
MVINLPCLINKKELAIPGQTATGKESSNPLMAGSLPKTNTATSQTINNEKQIHAIVDNKAVVVTEASVRSSLLLNDVDGTSCLTNEVILQNLALMGIELGEPFNDVYNTPAHTQKVFSNMVRQGNGYRWQSQAPRHHGGTPAQTRSERVLEQPIEPPFSEGHTSGSREGRMEPTFELTDSLPPTPHDLPLLGGYTPRSDEGRLKLEELIQTCTNFSNRVLSSEEAKTAQDRVITRLKLRVKRLEKMRQSRTSHPMKRRIFTGRVVSSTAKNLDEEDASKQGRIKDKTTRMIKESDFEELHDDIQDAQQDTVNAAADGVSVVSTLVTTAGVTISTTEPKTPLTTTIVFDDENVTKTLAQTLLKMKEHKAKEKGVAFREEEESPRPTIKRSITTLQPLPAIDPKDKSKGILVEEEFDGSVKIKRRNQGDAQIQADAELARQQKSIQDFKPMDAEVIQDNAKKDDSSKQPAEGSLKRKTSEERLDSTKMQKIDEQEEVQADSDPDDEEIKQFLEIVPVE